MQLSKLQKLSTITNLTASITTQLAKHNLEYLGIHDCHKLCKFVDGTNKTVTNFSNGIYLMNKLSTL